MRNPQRLYLLAAAIVLAACGTNSGSGTAGSTTGSDVEAPAAITLTAADNAVVLYRSGVHPERYATQCTGTSTLSLPADIAITGSTPVGVVVRDSTVSLPVDATEVTLTAGDGAIATVHCLPTGFPRIEQTGVFTDWSLLAALPLAQGIAPWRILLEPNGFPAWFQKITPSEFSDLSIVDGALLGTTPGDRPLGVYNNEPGTGFHRFGFDNTPIESWVPASGPGLDQHAAVVLGNKNLLGIIYEEVDGSGFANIGPVGDTSQPPAPKCPLRAPNDTERALRGRVVEVAPDGTVVHTWRVEEYLPDASTRPEWVNTATDGTMRCVLDADHLNAVQFLQQAGAEPGTGTVVVTGRDNDGAWAIDWPSGTVRWKFSGTTAPASLRIAGDPLEGVMHPHDAHLVADDMLLIYDNRTPGDERPAGTASRAALYRIDHAARTATLVSSVSAPCAAGPCGAYAMGSARFTSDRSALVVGVGLSREITAAEFPVEGDRFAKQPSATLHLVDMAAYRVVPTPLSVIPEQFR